MNREIELSELYKEALSLTRLQAMAIAQEQWGELVILLNKREVCLDRAETLLHDQPRPSNFEELSAMLRQIQQIDSESQHVFNAKQKTLMSKLKTLDHSRTALNGYLNALSLGSSPRFFDQDQ